LFWSTRVALSGIIHDTQNRKIENSKNNRFQTCPTKTTPVDIKTLQRWQMKDVEIVTVISETN